MARQTGVEGEKQVVHGGAWSRSLKAQRVFQSLGKRRRALFVALMIFSSLFVAMALAEQQLVHWQFYRTTRGELASAASTIREQVHFDRLKGRLDLKRYRNTPSPIPLYCLIGADGLLIDIGEVIPSVIGRVEQPDDAIFHAEQTVSTSANESWRVSGKKVDGGYVVLGILLPEEKLGNIDFATMLNADAKLERSVKAFGSTLSEATAITLREVDPDVEYAVVSSGGDLRAAWGGVPLKVAMNAAIMSENKVAHLTSNDKPYLLYYDSILNVLNKPIITIIVGKNLGFEEQALGNFDRFNYWIVGIALAMSVAMAFALLAREMLRQTTVVTLEEALKIGESRTIEFKSAFHWDSGKCKQDDELRLATLKTIAGFLNGSGGTLFIGVADADPPYVCGLDGDLALAGGSQDNLKLTLRHLITNRIGHEFSPLVADSFLDANDKLYWSVAVQPSPVPAFVTWKEHKLFFVRQGPLTSALNPESTYHYIKNKWG